MSWKARATQGSGVGVFGKRPGGNASPSRSPVGAGAAGIVIAALSLFLTSGSLRENFLASFLATLAGLLLGVPVAVWVTLRSLSAERSQEQNEARDHQKQVLTALRREMDENKGLLAERRSSGAREFMAPFLMDEVIPMNNEQR